MGLVNMKTVQRLKKLINMKNLMNMILKIKRGKMIKIQNKEEMDHLKGVKSISLWQSCENTNKY